MWIVSLFILTKAKYEGNKTTNISPWEIGSFNDVKEKQDNLALIIMFDTLLAVIAIHLLMHHQDMCI